MRLAGLASLLALSATFVVVAERDAKACGGCFHPPTETDSVITDHRMVFSISSQQTTLYDQIRYTGSPSSFAWVLPISGQATVGLSADVVFGALDSLTQTTVQQPPTNCPSPPSDCFRNSPSASFGSSADGSAADAGAGGVTVTKEEVVGPYETVQLHSTDPNALNTWLTAHGFNIPADVQPIVAAYVNEHFDFLALKLVPGAGVQSMRPVRVTTPGASPVLPLRMVAAGTGATVGITLWVLGEGRYSPQNFGSFQITSDDLVWDWASSASNYKELRAQREADGKSWETESSTQIGASTIQARITNPYYGGGFGGGPYNPDASPNYLGIDGGDGGTSETPDQVQQDDLDALFAGLPATVRVTRLRSDLAHASLATDLVLQASADQSELATLRTPTKESGQPTCAIYNGCDYVGQGPRDQAIAAAQGNNESFSCATSPTSWSGENLSLVVVAGFLGLAIVRSRRRKS